MKDLTDYLCSPTKMSGVSNLGCKQGNKTNENELKIQNNVSTKGNEKEKKKRKKAKRKPSDPAVKNIVDLFSNSLCIISPNNSFNTTDEPQKQINEQKTVVENDKNTVLTIAVDEVIIKENTSVFVRDETSQSNLTDTEPDKKQNDSSKSKNKLNAFQFMMESRNKSIGQNSPGKERPKDEYATSDEKEQKEIRSARKSLLQNWADKKGGLKRKREEEEKEEIINHKLEKRAKRLKKLLKVETPKEIDNKVAVRRTKRKIKRLSSSSSENSKDSVMAQRSNEVTTSAVLEVIDENTQDRVLNESKTKEPKQGLLTFFGVVNKTKKSEVVGKSDEISREKELTTRNSNASKSKRKAKATEELTNKSLKSVEKSDSEESTKLRKSKSKKDKFTEKCNKEYVSKKPNCETKDDGDVFTPRSFRSWKMKIKISDENSEKVEVKNKLRITKKVPNYKLFLSDDSSNEESRIDEVILSSGDELYKKKKHNSKPIKVAPVFTKATPKPKLAPEVVEARKQFLMSGIPDSLKKSIEKQQSVEDREYDVFPSISHVQQKCGKTFWNLPSPQLNLKEYSPLKLVKRTMCGSLTNSRTVRSLNIQKEVEKVDKLKTLLNKIKADNPNYPVYKSFKLIYEKSGKSLEKTKEVTKKNKKNRKRRSKSVEIIEESKPEPDSVEHAMWTDKYKPKCSDDIIGNTEAVKNLKRWLEMWKNFSEEINARKKKKRDEYCSDSDFDTTDCDSRDSTKLPGNTIIVGGPCGSGKSTTIYAICNELGFNVIELNASSKRTGKRLLQELQEATQSHQVRKKENLQRLLQTKEKVDKKMCVLLVEDLDIVFEQDDGFVTALSQLVSSSKRPIVLTTTDTSSVFVQKFLTQYEYIPFLPLSAQSLATWLQIVCLIEGLLVNQGDIGALLEFNKGDVRKTLLQLQFWVQSGGQIVREDSPLKVRGATISMEQKEVDDEGEPAMKHEKMEVREIFVHSDCIKSFEVFRHHEVYRVPYYLNLGLLWWNMPNILGIRSCSEERIRRFRENHADTNNSNKNVQLTSKVARSSVDKQKLNSLSKLYDSLAFTDVAFRAVNYFDSTEPEVRNYTSTTKDSLELCETMDGYDGFRDFVHELTHSLVNGHVKEFHAIERGESELNIAVPEKTERRWRVKMHVCEDVFLEALPFSVQIDRRSVALDYVPTLRNISRSESRRAVNNTKRGNRFRNYLRSVGVNCSDNTSKLARNILTISEDDS